MQMLDLISFSDYDELWIVGDVSVTVGPKSMKLLQIISYAIGTSSWEITMYGY